MSVGLELTTEDSLEVSRPAMRGNVIQHFIFRSIPILLALLAQIGFSQLGYTPTDDGWVLSQSRRVLAGEVPHRDFMILQPAGSEFLHAAEVAWGGDHAYWISRLDFWLEIAVIAWAWPMILSDLMKVKLNLPQKTCLGVLCFLFTSTTFSVLAWPTIDGLFLVSIGLLLCLRPESTFKFLGYALIGSSSVCKQNFAAVFPAVLVLLGDWKKVRYWAGAMLPGFSYVLYLQAHGAIQAVRDQIGSEGGIYEHGIEPYIDKYVIAGTIFGFVVVALLLRKSAKVANLAVAAGYIALLCAAFTLSTSVFYWFSEHTAWVIFGLALGATLGFLVFERGNWHATRAGLLVLAVAWAISISMGFNFTTLGCGVLVVYLILVPTSIRGNWFIWKQVAPASMAVLLLVSVVSYVAGRRHHIYRDRAAAQLTASLDGVLPGGDWIRTNPNTYAYLADLKLATHQTGGQPYAIVPGLPGYWVKADQLNPLPMEWPLAEAMPNPKMVDRFVQSLAAHRGNTVLIVEKVEPDTLLDGFFPLREEAFPPAILSYVRANFQKVGETRFFEIRR